MDLKCRILHFKGQTYDQLKADYDAVSAEPPDTTLLASSLTMYPCGRARIKLLFDHLKIMEGIAGACSTWMAGTTAISRAHFDLKRERSGQNPLQAAFGKALQNPEQGDPSARKLPSREKWQKCIDACDAMQTLVTTLGKDAGVLRQCLPENVFTMMRTASDKILEMGGMASEVSQTVLTFAVADVTDDAPIDLAGFDLLVTMARHTLNLVPKLAGEEAHTEALKTVATEYAWLGTMSRVFRFAYTDDPEEGLDVMATACECIALIRTTSPPSEDWNAFMTGKYEVLTAKLTGKLQEVKGWYDDLVVQVGQIQAAKRNQLIQKKTYTYIYIYTSQGT